MAFQQRRDGRLFAVAGASRSGKTLWTSQQVAREPRLLVWDYPKGEWATRYRCRRVSSFAELNQIVKLGWRAERVAFLRVSETPAEDFEAWCRMAWVYVRAYGAPLVAEETAAVTNPGKAPPAWGNICRMGLGYGSDIYALTQRPAESDKTALGNASVVHCGRFIIPNDRKVMAQYLGVSVDDVPKRPLDWVERTDAGELRRGVVSARKLRKTA